ncbi:hypothetical protein [Pseudomonas syringae]|uniref:hypothetical protein n=1 Tax=Pseudomonas syringae TaxID=317 RepID=UPI00020975DE|nr:MULTISPECIES: hypothetical protein [Pseudomonas syringae group]EGH97212.1 hypothetical protein PLA106_14009 [Pseudomonas amygdali pv. lachrymans str. M302278]MBF9244806.1 hypothetical protein [Pseudomonas syringae pv. tomato]
MLDRNNLQSLNRERLGHQWLDLTELEADLIKLYRQMSEGERRQIRRIAGYLVKPAENE